MGENYSEYMFKGTSVAFIAIIVIGSLGLVTRMFLSRSLSPSDYGTFYAVFSLIGLLSLFRGLGLSSTIVKFLPEFKEKENFSKIKSSIAITTIIRLAVSATISIILFTFAKQIATGYVGSEFAVPIIQVLSIWFILMGLTQTGRNVFQAFKDIPSQSSVELVRISVTFIGISVFAYFADLGTFETAVAFLTGVSISLLWTLFRLLQKHGAILSKGNLELSKPTARKLVFFGFPLIFAGLAGTLTSRIDTIVITLFRTTEEVGFYQVARPATGIISRIGAVVGAPLFPMVAELWAKDDFRRLGKTLYYVLKLTLVFLIPIVAVFFSFPEVVIRILFRPEFLPAAQAVRILSLTMVVTVLFSVIGKALVATGGNKLRAKIYGLAAVLNVVGDILFVPIFGIEGAAIAFLGSFLVALLVEIYYVNERVEFRIPTFDVGKSLLGGGIMIVLIYVLKVVLPLSLWPQLALIVLLTGMFYLIWILNTETLTPDDLKMLKETLPVPKQVIKIVRGLFFTK